jgi:hypothetical protein
MTAHNKTFGIPAPGHPLSPGQSPRSAMVGNRMKLQSTIRQWMVGTAMFAAGLTALLAVANSSIRVTLTPPVVIALWFGGAPLVGAGLLTPFGRPFLGVALGLGAQVLYTLYYIVAVVGFC